MEKPKIAVVNTSSELAICFSHLDGVAKVVKEAIRAAGGLPFEIRTTAPSRLHPQRRPRGNYILPSRDLITNDIEVQVEGAQLDGMMCLTSCDKTVPRPADGGGAARYPDHHGDLRLSAERRIQQPSRGHRGSVPRRRPSVAGKLSFDDLKGMSENAIRGPGVCSGMGTANSMHIVCEALGMSLPGAAPVARQQPAHVRLSRAAPARRIVEMVWEDLTPRKILTPAAFANAAAMVLAVSGSINCDQASAGDRDGGRRPTSTSTACSTSSASKIPVLTAMRPIGDYPIEALEAAGGAQRRAEAARVAARHERRSPSPARPLAENLKGCASPQRRCHPPASTGRSRRRRRIVMLRGSLAPDGAIIKLGLRTGRTLRFNGRARVFDVPQASMRRHHHGGIKAGDVIVLRGVGVRGGPGHGRRLAHGLRPRRHAASAKDVAVVTDGQLSGLVNVGLVIGEVTPESGVGGPLALVEDGDTIVIDVDRKIVDLAVPDAELAARRARLELAPMPTNSGWLTLYGRNVGPLAKGATLVGDR